MDLNKVDFNHDCHVDLHVADYGSLSGLFFTGKTDLVTLEQFFKDSHDWKLSFKRDGRQYLMGFVDPGNIKFHKFMQGGADKEKNQADAFYKQYGYYEQTHDFFEVWDENDISDVQISFPLLNN